MMIGEIVDQLCWRPGAVACIGVEMEIDRIVWFQHQTSADLADIDQEKRLLGEDWTAGSTAHFLKCSVERSFSQVAGVHRATVAGRSRIVMRCRVLENEPNVYCMIAAVVDMRHDR